MIERLKETTETALFLQQRVPDNYSATAEEHRWHCLATTKSVVVTDDSIPTILEKAHAIRNAAPERNDTEYRVVLESTTKQRWVLM